MVQEPLASVFRSGRDLFNARFAEARRQRPTLDAARFTDFIHGTLDPLARAWSGSRERLAPLVIAAYDVALQMLEDPVTGDRAGGGILGDAWRRLVPANWTLAESDPNRFFASVANALHHLTRSPGTKAELWIATMATLAPRSPDLETFLTLGQIVAWRAGLASYRQGALDLLGTVPADLALVALGAPAKGDLAGIRTRLQRDAWFDPALPPLLDNTAPRVVGRVGGFRGLGGNFVEPPVVAVYQGQWFVRSGDQYWLLLADAFGHAFHRATREEFLAAQGTPTDVPGIQVSNEAIVTRHGRLANPAVGDMTSAAVLPDAIALTSRHSHAIFLIAP